MKNATLEESSRALKDRLLLQDLGWENVWKDAAAILISTNSLKVKSVNHVDQNALDRVVRFGGKSTFVTGPNRPSLTNVFVWPILFNKSRRFNFKGLLFIEIKV